MDPKNVAIQTNAPPPNFLSKHEPEIDIWEPPFERWMKLADDLLSGWMCEASPSQRQRLKPPFRQF
jgi:hypothetical protein